MVKMHSGRKLEQGQVSAIVSLVSASIPYLDSANVTVIDQWGRLLSGDGENSMSGNSEKQFDFSRKLENHFSQRIEKLLTPLVGPGRVQATVSADLDFTFTEQTQESFEADPEKIRSEQRQEQDRTTAGAEGVPGALANQPPEDGAIQPPGEEGNEAGQPGANASSKLTRNYELDKTISHVRESPGKISRLSVAVIVDNMEVINDAGETITQPPTEDDLNQYTTLVKEAIGFNEERGDSVVVFNQPFQPQAEIEAPPSAPIWEQPWVWNVARQVLLGVGVLFLFFSIGRPALKTLKQQALYTQTSGAITNGKPGESTEDSEEQVSLSGQGTAQAALSAPDGSYGDILLIAQAMARDDPKRVARVVKEWVSNTEDEK